MKNIIKHLDKALESRIRLGIMSVLCVNDWVDFSTLKQHLELTDGNLASHIAGLEKNNYVEVRKQFVGKKPNTAFRVTQTGRTAFTNHLNALENLLKNRK